MLCRRAFRSRDCVVIIYGSITATISCLHYDPNLLSLSRADTAGRFCFTSSVSLHRALGRELPLAVEMLANAQISTCFVRLPLFSQFLYILYKILTAKSRTIFGMLNIFTAYFVEHSENTSGLLSSSLFTTAQPVGDISRLYQLIFVSQLC